jgi:hypothetical protein
VTHKIETVWLRTTPELEKEIADFWVAEKALPGPGAAAERTKQAVCIARGDGGELIAVCSAEPRFVPRLRQLLYNYRTFVAAAHRGSKLVYPMMLAARKALQEHTLALPKPVCIGMVIEFENQGLGQAYRMAFDEASRFSFLGYSPKGLDMRVSYFDGIDLQGPDDVRAAMKAAGVKPPAEMRRR